MLLLWSFPHIERDPYLSDAAAQCAKLKVVSSSHSSSRITESWVCCIWCTKNTHRLFTPNGPFNNKKKGGEEGLADNWVVACASGRNNFSGTDHGSGQWTVWAFIGDVRLNRQWCALHLWHCGEKNDIKHGQDTEEEQTTHCVESRSTLEGLAGRADVHIQTSKTCSSRVLV